MTRLWPSPSTVRGLKSKSGLPCDFPTDAIHHLSLYGLKTFEQIQAKSKLASIIFCKFIGYFGIDSSNNFLAGVVYIFSECDLSLGSSLTSVFHCQSGTLMSLVLGEPSYFKCKQLDSHGPVPVWFELSVHFLGGGISLSVCSLLLDVSSDVLRSLDFGIIGVDLLHVNAACLSIYMDGFLSNLGTPGMMAGAVVFFEDIDLGLGVGVLGLVSSTITELQAITLAFEYIPPLCSVDLFSDSQVALDACKLESVLGQALPYFKDHSGVSGNKHADALTRTVAFSNRCLPHMVSEWFLQADDTIVSDVEVLDHVFSCPFDAADHTHLMKAHTLAWKSCLDLSHSSFCILQLLHACVSNIAVSTALCKSFVFNNWYCESASIFKDSKVAAQNIVSFVHKFCLAFQDDIWLVCAKHQAIIEKSGLILSDDSVPVLVSGLLVVLLTSVVRLLGIADVFGVSFRFHKSYQFFSDIRDMVSVYIGD
ncbi:hypothetical protein G9A89_018981 [Geosiphon pyriformis]|nr:hypothetical protein G9A89_018981 [Geosiphon pyriformis]